MSNYGLFHEELLQGSHNLSTADVRVILVDLEDYGLAITGATNANPIVITSAGHGLSSGQRVEIVGVLGNTAANGEFFITVLDANTFSLQSKADGSNVAGNGAYTSGGFIIPLTAHENLEDVPAGARVAVSTALQSPLFSDGVFDADDIVITGVSGDGTEMAIVYKHTGNETTARLMYTLFGNFTPNGSNVNVQFPSNGIGAVH